MTGKGIVESAAFVIAALGGGVLVFAVSHFINLHLYSVKIKPTEFDLVFGSTLVLISIAAVAFVLRRRSSATKAMARTAWFFAVSASAVLAWWLLGVWANTRVKQYDGENFLQDTWGIALALLFWLALATSVIRSRREKGP
ncbi:hypothetical protein [Defluviimonas salinarum]|uniref:Uncharacterized protein n=1 Tax=Defluviimonas salinarum TaxID=2992147 RepID=A0ABT3J5Q8_9RHOB|nr:hypothetical protein [Defluviimonas salinarum]MCW3783014.1 hypothetical protein [Defluviimonas salinarum]